MGRTFGAWGERGGQNSVTFTLVYPPARFYEGEGLCVFGFQHQHQPPVKRPVSLLGYETVHLFQLHTAGDQTTWTIVQLEMPESSLASSIALRLSAKRKLFQTV